MNSEYKNTELINFMWLKYYIQTAAKLWQLGLKS